jgi:pimeloyl-ACP methyl ester carboxylesterase
MSIASVRQGVEVSEDAILFGTRARLAGIVTTPAPQANAVGVILLNAGVVHRVGPNRLYVTLARRLSRCGFTVLRFDHSGVGDSLPREDCLSFDESSVLEARDAMDWLAAERGCTAFVFVGLCSGTLTAFRTADIDARVSGLVLLTALLQDPSTVPPDVVAEAADRRVVRSYTAIKAVHSGTWLKVLTGRANYGHAFRTVRRLVFRRQRRVHVDAGTNAVIERMRTILQRGVSVHFIFAEPTTVLEYFRMTLEPSMSLLRKQGDIDVTILRHADHTFTGLRHQTRVLNLIASWLERRVPH